jgi:hypothetical protein
MNFQIVRLLYLAITMLLAVGALSSDAAAVSMEQARAQCHEQFVPIVRGCVRKKTMENGGNPSQYISGCRDAIMAQARECAARLIGVDNAGHGQNGPAEIDLPPPSGTGRVVLLLSGADGTNPYQDFAEKITKLGYYAVLIDGRQILSEDMQGSVHLQSAIAKAQSSPSALPGKIAVIGFSLGGGGALAYAERQSETVSTVITYYPATSFIAKASDIKTFVEKFRCRCWFLRQAKTATRTAAVLPPFNPSRRPPKSSGNLRNSSCTRTPITISSRAPPIAPTTPMMRGSAPRLPWHSILMTRRPRTSEPG